MLRAGGVALVFLVSALLLGCLGSDKHALPPPEVPLDCSEPEPTSAVPGASKSAAPDAVQSGLASWYGDALAGRKTASGERFDPYAMTAAHRTLPFQTWIEVTRVDTGHRVRVRITDRGPFGRKSRILDLSKRAAMDLGFLADGFTQVRIHTVDSSGASVVLDPALDQANPYTIQVAALAEKTNVDRLSKELQRASFGPVSLLDGLAHDGRPIQRIRVGSYTKLSEAEEAADKLAKYFKDRGVDPFTFIDFWASPSKGAYLKANF